MQTDSRASMTRHRLCNWLLCVALLLGSSFARGELYLAQDQSLRRFFTALSVPLGLPVVVSPQAARRQVSGVFDFETPQQVLELLAEREGLIWYSHGRVVYLYDAGEARSSAVALRYISVARLRSLMGRTGLDESRYPLRASGARTFYVSGPPSYVDRVLRLAQLMDRKPAEPAAAFGVVQVFNRDVADRRYGAGANTITVPGMVSLIEARLAKERKGAPADARLALIAYPDTNSLLIKGKPAQVTLIKKWVAELDVFKPPDDAALWQADNAVPPLLSAEQSKRVQRAFMRPGREISQ